MRKLRLYHAAAVGAALFGHELLAFLHALALHLAAEFVHEVARLALR